MFDLASSEVLNGLSDVSVSHYATILKLAQRRYHIFDEALKQLDPSRIRVGFLEVCNCVKIECGGCTIIILGTFSSVVCKMNFAHAP